VEPANVDQLCNAVSELLLDPGLARKFGVAGHQLIERDFSVNTMVLRYSKLYTVLCTNRCLRDE